MHQTDIKCLSSHLNYKNYPRILLGASFSLRRSLGLKLLHSELHKLVQYDIKSHHFIIITVIYSDKSVNLLMRYFY